jgi:Na+/glutamate symporter
VRVVVFSEAVRHQRRRLVSTEVETADSLFDASLCVAIAEMDRVTRVELIVAFDRVLDFPVFRVCVYVAIIESNRVSSGTTRE